MFAFQVGRSSASSVAFGMGMFAGQGTLGAGKQRAFSVITESKGHDVHLRFHDTCMAYKVHFCVCYNIPTLYCPICRCDGIGLWNWLREYLFTMSNVAAT